MENESKFEKYSRLNQEYLSSKKENVMVTIDDNIKYLIRSAYLEGYTEAQSEMVRRLLDEERE